MSLNFAGAGVDVENPHLGFEPVPTSAEASAGSGSPRQLTPGESGIVVTNEGCAAEVYLLLPTAAAGLKYGIVCQDAFGIRVVAAAGDTIRMSTLVSATGGYATTSAVGSYAWFHAINATEWVAYGAVGTFTVV